MRYKLNKLNMIKKLLMYNPQMYVATCINTLIYYLLVIRYYIVSFNSLSISIN